MTSPDDPLRTRESDRSNLPVRTAGDPLKRLAALQRPSVTGLLAELAAVVSAFLNALDAQVGVRSHWQPPRHGCGRGGRQHCRGRRRPADGWRREKCDRRGVQWRLSGPRRTGKRRSWGTVGAIEQAGLCNRTFSTHGTRSDQRLRGQQSTAQPTLVRRRYRTGPGHAQAVGIDHRTPAIWH